MRIIPTDKNAFGLELSEEEYQRFLKERAAFHDTGKPVASVYNVKNGGQKEIVFADVSRFEAETDAEVQRRRNENKSGHGFA